MYKTGKILYNRTTKQEEKEKTSTIAMCEGRYYTKKLKYYVLVIKYSIIQIFILKYYCLFLYHYSDLILKMK